MGFCLLTKTDLPALAEKLISFWPAPCQYNCGQNRERRWKESRLDKKASDSYCFFRNILATFHIKMLPKLSACNDMQIDFSGPLNGCFWSFPSSFIIVLKSYDLLFSCRHSWKSTSRISWIFKCDEVWIFPLSTASTTPVVLYCLASLIYITYVAWNFFGAYEP